MIERSVNPGLWVCGSISSRSSKRSEHYFLQASRNKNGTEGNEIRRKKTHGNRRSRFRANWVAAERVVTRSPVCSYNEWDPLEEVVVGRLEGATIPSKHLTVTFNIPQRLMKIYKLIAGLSLSQVCRARRPSASWTSSFTSSRRRASPCAGRR